MQQADSLKGALEEVDANILHLPMLEIEALAWDAAIKARILDYDLYDMAIFISSNAARLGMDCISNYWPQYPSHLKNFALGPTTAAVIESYDQDVFYPENVMSSEAVLALPEFAESELFNKRILIFRGVGGRETLAEGLRGRGAIVDYVELYKRNVPEYTNTYLNECWQESTPKGVVISSAEALKNFVGLFTDLWPDLFQAVLFVSSPRIKDLAIKSGFKNIIVMSGANDEAIIDSLKENGLG